MILYSFQINIRICIMFSNIKSIARSKKDSLVSYTILKIINVKAKQKNAEVHDFILDSEKREITVTFTEKNHPDPITLKASGYRITTKNGNHFLEVDKVEKSHMWDNSYIDGKRYKIPPEILKIAEWVL